MVNPAFVEVSSRKYLTSNAKRTNFNRVEARKYTADVKRFCGDCTEKASIPFALKFWPDTLLNVTADFRTGSRWTRFAELVVMLSN
ncbi:Hypothetical protein CINCED_3A004275 [Cinara cedri]|uniref:Uncharacterized protein n=1 Tax=Cinara cedri TaxID=506608 RepID=A0A5E4NDN9_9HEMI|nr:Hypothetical protein CINCED_3A004275 [Cinara cedri]